MRRNNKVYALATISIMIAIMLIFGFTPLGTISTPALTITLMGIPVGIIACVYGPIMGTVAGWIWGSIAIIQAFTGMDATGTLILSADTSIIPNAVKYGGLISICYCRIIVGFLTGVIYDLIKIKDKKGNFAPYIACMFTAILNTVLFMSIFCLFFYNTETIQNFCASAGLSQDNAFLFVCGLVGINFIAEFLTNSIIGGSVSLTITKISEKLGISLIFPHFFTKKEGEIICQR